MLNLISDSFCYLRFLEFNKNLFLKFIESSHPDHLYRLLILSRQLYHYKTDPLTTYKNWVKTTFGEMHYHLKSADKFKQTLDALQQVIFFDVDSDILDIHLQTAISSPRGSNHLVLEYKQMLRTRMASFVEPETLMDLT